MPFIAITGSYTNDDSSSPKIYTVDDSGNLAPTSIFGEVAQPSHLTHCPANKTIYAVSETRLAWLARRTADGDTLTYRN